MKHRLIIIITTVLSKSYCHAQDFSFDRNIIHAKAHNYSVTNINHPKTVINSDNTFDKGNGPIILKNSLPVDRKDKNYNSDNVKSMFYETFTPERLAKLAVENLDLQINYDLNLQGDELEMMFGFSDNSSLMPCEINMLEDRLRYVDKVTNNVVYEN